MNDLLIKLARRYPDMEACAPDLWAAFEILKACYRSGGKVLVCGNGGSAADSEHIVGELMKGFLSKRPIPEADRRKLEEAFPLDGAYLAAHLQGALPTISLVSQTSLLTAFANDVAPDVAFAQQVYGYGRPGDVLVGLSTSGNSKNILYAFQAARLRDMQTVGLTGKGGGRLRELCDVCICVPCEETYEVQERHQAAYHALCALLEEAFFC